MTMTTTMTAATATIHVDHRKVEVLTKIVRYRGQLMVAAYPVRDMGASDVVFHELQNIRHNWVTKGFSLFTFERFSARKAA